MGFTPTNRHGVASIEFATVFGCGQLVLGTTHARGATLDLLMTGVSNQVWVAVVAQMSNSDYSSLSAVETPPTGPSAPNIWKHSHLNYRSFQNGKDEWK